MSRPRQINRQVEQAHAAVDRTEPALRRAYQRGIAELLHLANRNFRAKTQVAVAAGAYRDEVRLTSAGVERRITPGLVAAPEPPDPTDPNVWPLPDLDELFTLEEGAELLELRTRAARDRMAAAATGVWAHELEPAVRNRITGEILRLLGQRITEVTAHVRDHAGVVVRRGLDEGWSIRKTARELSDTIPEFSRNRSMLIARTESIGAANAGSLATVRALGAADYKVWHARMDSKTRPTHAEANGQKVRLDDLFTVDGVQMDHPGAEGAPAAEVCNCRCVIIYEEDPVKPITSGGAREHSARVAAALAELPDHVRMNGVLQFVTTGPSTNAQGEETGQTAWAGMLAPLATKTDDGRMLDPAEPGAIGWRELPLSLMAQFETQPGHDGAVVAGRIDTIEVGPASFADWSGQGFNATGVFDDAPGADGSEDGRRAARLSRDGMLRGVSVDLAVDEMELRTADNEPIPDDDEEAWLEAIFGGGIMAVTRGSIMGATLTPFPAFSEANVTVVASLEHAQALLAAAPAPEPAPAAVPVEGVLLEAIPAQAAPALTLEQAQAYATLVAGGMIAVNDVRAWLGLEAVAGGHVLRETVAPVAPPVADPNGVIASALAVLAANSSAPPAAPQIVQVSDPPPRRRLRVNRDSDGQVVGYEEVPADG